MNGLEYRERCIDASDTITDPPESTRAIVLHRHGGPEELLPAPIPLRPVGDDEILIRHTAINVNFHDIYVRTGQYRTLNLPGVMGLDAVGVIEGVGPAVEGLKAGDRIAWIDGQYGGYATRRVLPANKAFLLPAWIEDAQAAATLMKAFTVRMLVRDCFRVEAGQTVLIHAAAGGVGQLLCQWCKALGAHVIGTVSTDAKAAVARANGVDDVVFYRRENCVERVQELTGNRGVAAVFDSVGRDTFMGSLQCLDYNGTLISFGQSSGPAEPFTPADLARRSLTVTRPILFHKIRQPAELQAYVREVFDAISAGIVRLIDPEIFPLSRAGDAHRLVESGESPGGVILVPEN